ncbi:hypothetical protein DL96DRAFT_1643796 [Flagelloscypha sp. PMI_526]|nr:hypothetical protein DL96DRAFT_1643796 [Flagelloscypha sp. PMI_526]
MHTLFGSSVLPIIHCYLPPERPPKIEHILVSLKEAEELFLSLPTPPYDGDLRQPLLIIARSLEWLFTLSSNAATRRIVTAAVYGCFIEYWQLPCDGLMSYFRETPMSPSLRHFLQATPWPSMMNIAFTDILTQSSPQPPTSNPTKSSSRAWTGILDVLFCCSELSEGAFTTRFAQARLHSRLEQLTLAGRMQRNFRETLLRWGVSTGDISYICGVLYTAIKRIIFGSVQWSLDRGSSINEDLSIHGTPLMCACFMGFEDAVKLSIGNGADVNQVIEGGYYTNGACTPLTMCIAGLWNPEIGQFLLENGARINETFVFEGKYSTTLQYAAHVGNPGAVRCLLERGAAITPKIKDTLHRLNWVGASARRGYPGVKAESTEIEEIEGMLRAYASRTMYPHCLPTNLLGPVLTRKFLA